MANVKITELTAATALAGTDVLPIVDVGADATKKVSVSDLLRNLPDGTASAPALAFADDQNSGILSPANNELAFATSGTQRLVIDSSGNVGIGETSPSRKLHINSGTTDTAVLIESTDAGCQINFQDSTSAASGISLGCLGDAFYIRSGLTTERLRVDSSGRLLLGTTTEGEGNADNLTIADSGNCGITIRSGTSGAGNIFFSDGTSGSDEVRGSVEYNHASNFLKFNTDATERLRIDSSGNVCIGTTSSNGRLHVKKDGTGEILQIWQSDLGTNNRNIQLKSPSSDSATEPFTFATANSFAVQIDSDEAFRIDSSGRVGIGTSSLSRMLTVDNDGESFISIRSSNTGNAGIEFGDQGDSVQSAIFHNATDNSLRFNGYNNSERLRIDSSGRLLVGHSSSRSLGAQQVVQIEGTNQQTSSMSLTRNSNDAAPPNIVFGKSRGTSTGSNTVVQSGDDLGIISFHGADGTDLNTGAASIKAEVDGTPGSNDMPGRLVFSTTADGASSPTERLAIKNDGLHHLFGATAGLVSRLTASAGTSDYFFAGVHSATAPQTGGTVSFRVWSNGNVINTNNSYGAISDIKLKENIVDASSQWDDLKAIQVRNYNFKEGQTHTQIGVVAQEVETVSPGLVTESPDRDEENNDLGTTTKSVNYSVLYMKAVKALQEAMNRIETLEAKVAALEAQ